MCVISHVSRSEPATSHSWVRTLRYPWTYEERFLIGVQVATGYTGSSCPQGVVGQQGPRHTGVGVYKKETEIAPGASGRLQQMLRKLFHPLRMVKLTRGTAGLKGTEKAAGDVAVDAAHVNLEEGHWPGGAWAMATLRACLSDRLTQDWLPSPNWLLEYRPALGGQGECHTNPPGTSLGRSVKSRV